MDNLERIVNLFNLPPYDTEYEQWHKINCPFHEDKNASASLKFFLESPGIEKVYFNCFGPCSEMNGPKSLEEFLNMIDEDGKVTVGWKGGPQYKVAAPPERTKAKPLSKSQEIEQYGEFLAAKGFDPPYIESLGGKLVTDPDDWDYGYLVFKYGRGGKHKTGRLIFKLEGRERFLNAKGNKGLLGIELIAQDVKEIILCEGLTDWLSLRKKFTNVVCSLGCQLSKEQAYQLKGKTVFILYDKDQPGYDGARKARETLRDYKATTIILEIPDSMVEDNQEKVDANFLMHTDEKRFVNWITDSISQYSTYDSSYIKNNFRKAPKLVYYKTGIKEFDKALGGGLTKGLHVFGGEPKIGKSTFLVELASSLRIQNARVLFCSYELSKEQLWSRVAARDSVFSWQEIEANNDILDEKNWRLLEIMSEKVKIVNNFSLPEIEASLDSFDVYFIDYLQRMQSKKDGEMERIKENIEGLARLVQDNNKIFVLITEISREKYRNQGDMGIAKGSGEVEYCAQSLTRLNKIGDKVIEMDILANTRGQKRKVYCEVDYQHQRLTEKALEEVYNIPK